MTPKQRLELDYAAHVLDKISRPPERGGDYYDGDDDLLTFGQNVTTDIREFLELATIREEKINSPEPAGVPGYVRIEEGSVWRHKNDFDHTVAVCWYWYGSDIEVLVEDHNNNDKQTLILRDDFLRQFEPITGGNQND